MSISRKDILKSSGDDFIDQRILSYDEICSFNDDDIESLKGSSNPSIQNTNLILLLRLGSAFLDIRLVWV